MQYHYLVDYDTLEVTSKHPLEQTLYNYILVSSLTDALTTFQNELELTTQFTAHELLVIHQNTFSDIAHTNKPDDIAAAIIERLRYGHAAIPDFNQVINLPAIGKDTVLHLGKKIPRVNDPLHPTWAIVDDYLGTITARHFAKLFGKGAKLRIVQAVQKDFIRLAG